MLSLNITELLRTEGAIWHDVVRTTCYLRDIELAMALTAEHPAAPDLEKAYAALLAPASRPAKPLEGRPAAARYVDTGRARTSWLMWQMCGADTSRPWDHSDTSVQGQTVKAMPPPGKGPPLSPEKLRTMAQWIDLGAPYEAPKGTELPVAAKSSIPV